MKSSNTSAQYRHTHRNKHRHIYQGYSSRAHRSEHRQHVGPLPRVVDHFDHNKESLVQNWLEDLQSPRPRPVDNEGYSTGRGKQRKRSRAQSADPSPVYWTPHGMQFTERYGDSGSFPGSLEGRQRHRHHRKFGEDSSIIAPIEDHHQVRDRVEAPSLRLPTTEECYYERGKKRQQKDSEASSLASGALAPADHHFEKRTRRKTRDDRYNTVKFDKEKKPKKHRKQSRNKSDKFSSAREVMNNFNSNTILNDRITMQPSLRPGLFDNGRTSKKQLPDLTFHEMAFLKQPRREPLKSTSRSRENERRRSERELEEVSAFFLHKTLPESYDASGRKQTAVTGLSSLDEVMGNSSAYTREYQNVLNCGHGDGKGDHDHPRPREQMLRQERENSRATSCFTWSTSHHSNDPGLIQSSEIPKRQHETSSTPIQVREALARTGVYDNTGIHSVASRQRHDIGSTTRLNGQLSNLKSPQVSATYTVQGEEKVQSQPIRIVRYHDRGTMANEDEVCKENPLARCGSTNLQENLLHAVDHSLHKDTATNPISVSQATTGQPAQRGAVSYPEHTSVGTGTPFCQGEDKMGPDRPRSPKWAVVEQLEAAAENTDPQNSQTNAAAGWMMQQNNDGTANDYDMSVFKGRELVTQVPCSGTFRSARPDWPYLPELGRQHGQNLPPEQEGDVPRQSTIHLTPRKIHLPVHDVGQLAFGYSLVPNASHGIQSDSLTQRYATMHSNDFVGSSSISQNDIASSIATNPVQKANDIVASRPSRGKSVSLQGTSGQQSMREYIAQLEQDVFSRPQEEDGEGGFPTLHRNGVQEHSVTNLAHLDDSQGFEPHVEDCGQTVGLWDTSLCNQAPGRASLQSWVDVRNMEGSQEEERFASTFWRPNRYPI